MLFEAKKGTTSSLFEKCPVVWDTGASYGLTPFRCDFIDYEEVHLPVQDIAHTNYVVGIGTVMWKFKAINGDPIYLPILCYHLPTADIRLLSPQTYHQLHGGESSIVESGTRVAMKLPQQGPTSPTHVIEIPIDLRGTNLPVIHDVACTDKEREIIGPRLRSSLAKRAMDFQGSWKEAETSLARKDIGLKRH